MPDIGSICVYCGSAMGHDSHHREAARRLGRLIGEACLELVYGGGNIGLMGVLADAALEAGGKVTGVIPTELERIELAHKGLDDLVVVGSMHDRKRRMFERADAFCALAGGVGTLDEAFEIITWKQLGLHDKPIVVVNQDGYWQPFLDLVDHVIGHGFSGADVRALFAVVEVVDDVLPTIAAMPAARGPARPERT